MPSETDPVVIPAFAGQNDPVIIPAPQFLPRSGAQMDVSEGRQAVQQMGDIPFVSGLGEAGLEVLPKTLGEAGRMVGEAAGGPAVTGIEDLLQEPDQLAGVYQGLREGKPLAQAVEEVLGKRKTYPEFNAGDWGKLTGQVGIAGLQALPFVAEGLKLRTPTAPLRTEPLMPEPPPTQPIGPGTTAADVSNALDWTPQSAPVTPLEQTVANVQPPGPYVSPETGFTHYPGLGEGHAPVPSDWAYPPPGTDLKPIALRGPNGSTPAADVAAQATAQQRVTNLPSYMQQNVLDTAALLEKSGMANQIEELAAQRLTAKQIADKLGIPVEDVSAVRITRGIPSMNLGGLMGAGGGPQISPEFEAWVKSRQAPVAQAPTTEAPLPYTPEAAAARSQQASGAGPTEAVGGNVAGFEKVYGPGEIAAGETVSPEDAWDAAHLRATTGKAKPYGFVDRARTGAITPEEMGDLIYEHHRLVERAAGMEGMPDYAEASQAAKDFASNVLKPAETAWHQKGMVMQIERPVNLNTFTGMDQLMEMELKRGIKPSEAPKFKEMADDIKNGESEVTKAVERADAKVRARYSKVPDIPIEEAVARVKQMLKDCM